MLATTHDAFDLLLQGSIALCQMEENGIKINEGYLNKTIENVSNQIKELESKLTSSKEYSVWKNKFRDKTNIGSRTQLAQIIFGELGHPYRDDFTVTGRFRADEEVLASLKLPFLNNFLRLEKLKKLKNTHLEGIQCELVDGLIHPFFNLHTVETYRSSANAPAIQTLPIRDPEMGEYIRRCIIPRKGHYLVETDYSAMEFKIAACFWKDPAMIKYASDSTLDIHRDMAAKCYLIDDLKDVSKDSRYCAKNGFVFPRLYGSYYVQIARNMWHMIRDKKLKVANISMKKHLATKGIRKLGLCNANVEPMEGTFEYLIKQVQDWFDEAFPVYASSRKKWIEGYRKNGWFQLPTGFKIAGAYSNNFLLNSPIQCLAFNCLLWTIIHIQKELNARRMKTKPIAEIHDAILADSPEEEVDDYVRLAKKVMTEDIRKEWDWIVVPLLVETQVSETNWFEKEKYNEVI